jgi:peroxiredoxin
MSLIFHCEPGTKHTDHMKTFYILFTLSLAIISETNIYGQMIDYNRFGIETVNNQAPEGLKPGDTGPAFSGYDQKGKFTESKKILEKGPMVLFFYRGNWCPVCNKYLQNYQDSLAIIADQGFSVVAITPESIEYVETTVKMHNLSFIVIYDCMEKIMADYKVMFSVTDGYQKKLMSSNSTDLKKINGHPEAHLPVPATYIINSQGIVVATWFDPDYRKRASVKWMLQNLAKAL